MERDIQVIKNLLIFLSSIVIAYLLKVLSYMFIPLVLAIFIAIVLYPILTWFRNRRIPFWASIVIIFVVGFFLLNGVGNVIIDTVSDIIADKDHLYAQIQHKATPFFAYIKDLTGIDLNNYSESAWTYIQKFVSFEQVLYSSSTFASFLSSLAGTLFMTLLYLFVTLGGILQYDQYLNYLEKSDVEDGKGSWAIAFEEVMASINTYMKVKLVVSLATGLCFSLICSLCGVDYAFFWGFLACILNFIPTFGSIIASVPPILLGWVQIEVFGWFILFVMLLLTCQTIIGNVVEPMMMGNSLSINTVFVFLALVVWGYLWGITGSILSVPMLVLIRVILQQMPDAQFLVRLMGNAPEPEKK